MKVVNHFSEEKLKKLHVKTKDPPESKMTPHHRCVDWNDIMRVNRDYTHAEVERLGKGVCRYLANDRSCP